MMNMYVDQQGFRYRTQISTYEMKLCDYGLSGKISIQFCPNPWIISAIDLLTAIEICMGIMLGFTVECAAWER